MKGQDKVNIEDSPLSNVEISLTFFCSVSYRNYNVLDLRECNVEINPSMVLSIFEVSLDQYLASIVELIKNTSIRF